MKGTQLQNYKSSPAGTPKDVWMHLQNDAHGLSLFFNNVAKTLHCVLHLTILNDVSSTEKDVYRFTF